MKNDPDLQKKTTMTADNAITLFKQCVQTTYFVFNKKLYKQVDGLAIGASSSGPAAELFMEKLEVQAITTFIDPPKIWMRYVDDTFSKLKKLMVDRSNSPQRHNKMNGICKLAKARPAFPTLVLQMSIFYRTH